MSDYLKKLRASAELRVYARNPRPQLSPVPITADNYRTRLSVEMASVVHQAAFAAYAVIRKLNVHEGIHYPDFYANKQRADGYINNALRYLENPPASETIQHNRWCDAKMAEGWVWGDEYDAEKKIHPDLVPYSQLTDAAKAKGSAVLAIHESILKPFVERFNEL